MDDVGLTDWRNRRYWLVGCSEGLGRALAGIMSRAGMELILSARTESRLASLKAELPGRATVLPLDVTDAAAVRAAAAAAGRLDGVVYLAGLGWSVKATEWDAARVDSMLDVNLMGAARVLGAVVPEFVARNAGHVVLTGSLSAYRGLPGAVGYGASKAGLMSLAEAMHLDLKETGVRVQIVNPGFIRTNMTAGAKGRLPSLMEVDTAAREMWEHMASDNFARAFPFGLAALARLSSLLPLWLYELLMPRREF